jgi:biotin biosynthesis protein BioC
MSSRKTAITYKFNRSASSSYDTHAQVQRKMSGMLAAAIRPWMPAGNLDKISILEIGCGTGDFTKWLLDNGARAAITAIDIAPAMIQAAKERVLSNDSSSNGESADHVQFVLADIEVWAESAPSKSFDLIVSNACFQWLSNPEQTMRQLGRLLREDGLLAFSTFGPGTFHELHASFDEAYVLAGRVPQRHGLSFLSAQQWDKMLIDTEFSNIRYEQLCCKEEYGAVRDFLMSVKAQGASASDAVMISNQMSRRLFTDMYKVYESKFSTAGGIAATYDLLIVLASAK